MGNVIRLGIARVGLAFNSFWTATSKKTGRKPPVVILVLGAQEVGKTVVASRISNCDEAYLATRGFSMLELKDKGTSVRLYDLGGADAVRELWPHYYPDAHGIIFVVDTSGRTSPIGKQAEILAKVLQDDRIKRKPLLVLGNKQDVELIQTEQLITQMDLIQTVNVAKCLTRVDMTSKEKLEGFEDGLMVGFRWLVNYIKWHWGELSERVEQDSFLEKTVEKSKFEALHLKSATASPVKVDTVERTQSAVGSPSDPLRQFSAVSRRSTTGGETVTSPVHSEDNVLMVLPLKRLDPEGGNDIKEWIPDATHQVVLQPDTEDELPEVVIVESRAEVHFQRHRSESAVTLNSMSMSTDGQAIIHESLVEQEKCEEEIKITTGINGVLNGVKPKTSHGHTPSRPKLFRNKTAPVTDEPIRIPLTTSFCQDGKEVRPAAIFQV